MEHKDRFRLLKVSIEGLESELQYSVMTRKKIEKGIQEAVERILYGNVSCSSELNSNTFNVVFNLEDLPGEIKTKIEDLFSNSEKNPIQIKLDS